MSDYTVGIDLGTTNSCVAIFRNGHVEIIENDQGLRTTPSWVSFTEDLILIGSEAVEEYPRNPKNTVYEAKRLIGQKFKDVKVQEDIQRLPYTVCDDLDSPKIRIQLENGTIKEYYPEEISAFILKKLKEVAEARLQTTVRRAVITVPAYFNDAQRQATKDAATIAGFSVINVINEPTAAALAFNYHNPKPYKRNIVVYDFGGGTFDVSIVAIERGKCSVKSTKGNSHLGGLDIDAKLVQLIKEDFKKQQGKELDSGDLTTRRLTAKCENAKKILSTRHQVEVEMDYLAGIDTSFKFNIARIRLEQLNSELFKETLETVKECLEESGIKKDDIDEVVLVGGSSRIPKIQQILSDYFGPDKINKGINPDEAVAFGAAIHASNLAGDKNEVHDVTSLSLGTNTYGDLMSIIIPRNTPIPAKSIKRYQTIMDNQTSMEFPIYQGEKEIASENFELGNFTLANLTEGPAKSVKVEISFKIDSEGLLNISATEINSSNKQDVQINVKRKGLTEEQIRQRIIEAESNREKEKRRRRFTEEKHNLETFLYEAKVNAEKCEATTRDLIVAKHDEIWKWLEKVKIEDVDQFEIKKNEMKKIIEENASECESK